MVSSAFRSRGINGIPEIQTFFRTNEQPIIFVGPTFITSEAECQAAEVTR